MSAERSILNDMIWSEKY